MEPCCKDVCRFDDASDDVEDPEDFRGRPRDLVPAGNILAVPEAADGD